MEIGGRRIWQFAAGDSNRSYQDLCLRWDAIMFGPGYAGPWPDCEEQLKADGCTTRKRGLIRRFCEEVSEGDLIVLRVGTAQVYGVGEVVGDYAWYSDFEDVDGWNLQHVRRVRWLWQYADQPKTFSAYALKLGDTIQSLTGDAVRAWLESVEVAADSKNREVVALPPTCVHSAAPSASVTMTEIADTLFDFGVGAVSIEALTRGIDDLRRIASWYDRADIAPSESETVAYLVVPLLRALGWTPQRMAVEWNHVDLALFQAMPRINRNLAIAVEVKKRGKSCLNARSQAEGYAEQPGRESCLRLIVTDGIRYGVYIRQPDAKFPDRPAAYLNLTRTRSKYPVLECKGASEALQLMSVDWSPSP
mgnify:CR=1 FL=1